MARRLVLDDGGSPYIVDAAKTSSASTTTGVRLYGPNDGILNWQVQGRLAAINGNESWPASVRWEQNQQTYAVDLIGPLGQGRISVRGDASRVELSTGQERLQARDPDALLAQATGLQVPISGLKYWIRGIPDPATPARIERNADGRIARLEQNGWRIDYPNWIQEQGIDLPKRIQAVQDALKVNIAITTWTLPQ